MNALFLALVMAGSPASEQAPPQGSGVTLGGGAVVVPAVADPSRADPKQMTDQAVRDYDVVRAAFDPATARPIA